MFYVHHAGLSLAAFLKKQMAEHINSAMIVS